MRSQNQALGPELEGRDGDILRLAFGGDEAEGYDFVQVTLSVMDSTVLGGEQRLTYKTRHLPIEAVRAYLGDLRESADGGV